ncbi:MAG: LptF/LptG family permease [Alphaproteobacteria bacterium]
MTRYNGGDDFISLNGEASSGKGRGGFKKIIDGVGGMVADGRALISVGILYFWLLKRFIKMMFSVMLLVFSILFLISFVESFGKGFYNAAIKSLFNSIDYFYNFLPFIFILATILFFSALQEKSELTAARVLSFGPWQIATPALSVALLFGIFYVFGFSPLSAKVNETWVNIKKPSKTATTLEWIDKEFWLKETWPKNTFVNSDKNYLQNFNGSIVIHGYSLLGRERKLKDAQFFLIGDDGVMRIIFLAEEAILKNNQWQMVNVTRYEPGRPVRTIATDTIPSLLNQQSIKDLLLSPKELSVYKLNRYLEGVKDLGFSTYAYDVYFHRLIALPFILLAMTLLAAAFSFQYKTRGQRTQTILIAIILGFFVHFFFEMIRAFIISQELPAFLTAWLPAAMMMLLSVALFLHREEH